MRIRNVTTTALLSVVVVLVAAAPSAGRKPVPKDLPQPIRQALEAIQTTSADPGPAAGRGRPADTAAGVRDSAAARLARMGAKATPAIPFLAGMLEKDHVWRLVTHRARIRTPSMSAVSALRGVVDAAGAEHLTDVLKHDNWVVRANLVYVLTGVKTPAAIKLLGATVHGDREVRVRVMAARALGRVADKAAVNVLIAAMKDPDPLVRKEAAYSLKIAREMGNYQIYLAVKAMTPLTRDKDQGVRHYVAMAFKEIGSSNALRPLRTLLKDPDATVRYYAADALGVIKGRRAVPALIAALEAEKDPKGRVQLALVRALGATGDPRATTPLIGCLKHSSEYVRRDAAGALGLIGDRRAVPALIRALNDEKPSVRDSTARAMGLIRDVRALDPLIAALARYKSSAAAVALGQLNHPKAIRPLAEALYDVEGRGPRPHRGALEGLALIKHPDVVVQLVEVILSGKVNQALHPARLALRDLTGHSFTQPNSYLRSWWKLHRKEYVAAPLPGAAPKPRNSF